MPTVLIASNNAHKLQEMREIFELAGAAHVRLITPADAHIDIDPAETGLSYKANALIKARAFAAALREKFVVCDWVLADDSGIEVDVLNGRPGLLSARYAKTAPGGDGCKALLNEMIGVPRTSRSARFRCVIAISTLTGVEHTFEGVCEGSVHIEPRGSGGFGYDPIFLVDGTRCMAELSPREKHTLSHRGKATRAAIATLRLNMNGDTHDEHNRG
jgi:XTP/dITP diphosphohydrolase